MNGVENALHGWLMTGQLERVVTTSRSTLEREPESLAVQYYLALALIRLERVREAEAPVQFLLDRAPDLALAHHVACEFCTAQKKHRKAREHIRTAVSLDPDSSVYHLHHAMAALRLHMIPEARSAVDAARRLAPEDPGIIRAYVEIHGLTESSARSAWERLHKLEAGLSFDPENAGLHTSIADIHLTELDQPDVAEAHYRESLRRDPANIEAQKGLFQAVARQRFLYRLLSIPSLTGAWLRGVGASYARQPWRLVLLLLLFKAAAAFFVWLLLATLVLLPPCKLYEWVMLTEYQPVPKFPGVWWRCKRWLGQRPFWVRFGMVLLPIVGAWLIFFHAIHTPLDWGFSIVGGFIAIHASILAAVLGVRRIRVRLGRKVRRSGPPPLPA